MALFFWIYFIFIIFIMLIMWYGIYSLSKKMWLKHSWLWWFPYLQYYTMVKISWLDFVRDFLLPIVIYILALIAWALFSSLGGALWMIWFAFSLGGFIYFIYKYIRIFSKTSKRTWRGGWTTAGLFFVPFIMYPVIASKYKEWFTDNTLDNNKSKKKNKKKEKIEL